MEQNTEFFSSGPRTRSHTYLHQASLGVARRGLLLLDRLLADESARFGEIAREAERGLEHRVRIVLRAEI